MHFPDAVSFVVEEKECPVLFDRPADHGAELVAPKRLLAGGVVIPRIENVVPQKLEHRSGETVASRLGLDIENASGASAEFGAIGSDLKFEFLNGIDRGCDRKLLRSGIGSTDAIQQEVVVSLARSHGVE